MNEPNPIDPNPNPNPDDPNPNEPPETLDFVLDRFRAEGRSEQEAAYEQARSYTEARKALGEFTGAPDQYAFNLPEGIELPEGVEISSEDPMVAAFAEWGKENKLSQNGHDGLIGLFVKHKLAESAAEDARIQEEMAKIENGEARIGEIDGALKAFFGDEHADKYQAALEAMTDSATVEAFEMLLNKSVANLNPGDLNPGETYSESELRELMFRTDEHGNRLYPKDKEIFNKVQAMLKIKAKQAA